MGTVILRRRALGDVVLVGAITASLPRPVLVATEPRFHPVVRRMASVDEVQSWSAPLPRDHRVVDLGRTWRVGWPARRLQKHSLARRLRLWGIGRGRPEVTELYARAAQVDVGPLPWIQIPREPAPASLVLFPGASTPLKQVPIRLLEAACRGWPGPVLAVGGPGDEIVLEALHAELGIEVVHDPGFDLTFAVLGRARVAVGGDSGLSHLAAACGVPTVVIAGPTHPDDGFLGHHFARVVDRELGCRPCTLHRGRRCHRGGRPCFDLDSHRIRRAVAECAG